MRNNPIIICGQTATGKSSLAIELALHLKQLGVTAEVISADSRQVYTGLDTSSNKVTTTEMRGITHHMLSITPCGSRYSVADFQTKARSIISDLVKRGITPILCGGTGLYIDAVMFDAFKFGEGLRGSIDYTSRPWNPNGSPLQHLSAEENQILWIGLTAPREYLVERIKTLAEQKFERIKNEISNLLETGVAPNWFTSLGLESKFMISVLDGSLSEKDYIEQLTTQTWQYARRQMTWFKRNPHINWFDVSVTSQAEIIDSLLK